MEADIISVLKRVSSNSCKYPLKLKHAAGLEQIRAAEERLKLALPVEIFSFYCYSNGAEGDDNIFNILPVEELQLKKDENGNCVVFSEYLIYSEVCGFVPDTANHNSFSVVRRIGSTPIDNYAFPVPVCYSLGEYVQICSREGTFGIWS
ncbi:MAG: hypothetical protein INR73_06985 [Williamsia sp.]|nr:hypothetical protein [Williamsia sp.]